MENSGLILFAAGVLILLLLTLPESVYTDSFKDPKKRRKYALIIAFLISALHIISIIYLPETGSPGNMVARSSKGGEEEKIPEEQSPADQWWNERLKQAPSYKKEFSELSHISFPVLLEIYRIINFEIRHQNSPFAFKDASEKISRGLNLNITILSSIYHFMDQMYYPFLSESMLDYYKDDPAIKPVFIHFLPYIGFFTLDLDLQILACKDDDSLKEILHNEINRLKSSLPSFMDGFRVRGVKYVCTASGLEGFLDGGYVWKRNGNLFSNLMDCAPLFDEISSEEKFPWCYDSFEPIEIDYSKLDYSEYNIAK